MKTRQKIKPEADDNHLLTVINILRNALDQAENAITKEIRVRKTTIKKSTEHELVPFLDELRKIENNVGKEREKLQCFTRRDVQKLLESHNISLNIKAIERRLNALVAKGMVTKFFESLGHATLYRAFDEKGVSK